MLEFDWYSYQCFWCWFGSARTWSLLLTQSAQITLDWCMHLLISLSTWSIYIRRHCSQFSQCEDQRTGWCTKAHTNFFANDNTVKLAYMYTCLYVYLPICKDFWLEQTQFLLNIGIPAYLSIANGILLDIPIAWWWQSMAGRLEVWERVRRMPKK